MSDTDDRMERAERIRKMRESREPGEEDAADGESADSGSAAGETSADAGRTEARGVPADASGADDGAGNDTGDDAGGGAATSEGRRSEGAGTDGSSANAGGASAVSADADGASEGSDPPPQGAERETAATAEADVADVTDDELGAGLAPLGDVSDYDLPGESVEDATGDHGASGEDGPRDAGGVARTHATAATEDSVRVLEFTVGEQVYCIDIERVEEIVKREEVTRVPNTDEYVEGVVDLRGQITTILDTKRLLDVAAAGRESLMVVFAPDAFEDHGTVGWVVDEVRQVVPVTESQVRSPPSDADHVRGVVDREDELVVWIRPGEAMTQAVDVAGGE